MTVVVAHHHGHHAGAVSVAELLNRQVKPCRPGLGARLPAGVGRHLEHDLPHRAPEAVDPPIKRFYIQDDPAMLARVLAGLRRLP